MIKIESLGLKKIEGPILMLEKNADVKYDEVVRVFDEKRNSQIGKVLSVNEKSVVVQVFGNTSGLTIKDTSVEFLGIPMTIPVGRDMLGRVFNGLGEPFDGLPQIFTGDYRDVNGAALNPYIREYPRDFIQTGISVIDGLTTLIRGQKLPIFSGNGLPHNVLAAQIARQATLKNATEEFTVVFAGMGVKYDVAKYFIDNFERSGVLSNVVMYLSLADAPSVERLLTPRAALTAAEYLAYDLGMHVLVIMTDMTNYCEALREVSTTRGQIPSRKGYPGYLYSDLASLYERAGRIKNKKGSITQIPILSMPNDDITHPIPDLTGYITEGQIVLERELFQKNVYPPVAGLPSLSRLMKDGIGEGMTREDHKDVSSQLFACYAKVKEIRALASVIGEEELSDLDRKYLDFGNDFENKFLSQGYEENRTIEATLDLAWELLKTLPESELYRINDKYIQKYLHEKG
ncbi:MAG TPA: V-type ATP synthase subunit B [Spirochaetota bacterium]|nr:V-type ATP synthase subunit B [Spirochaetota bacterium]HOS33461.1 V-type ATP synthase subunit B [Spirochaetota bacterium]HOS56251.1 V-type ATP synthase subunit B [Spirochaetota bacterium]HQF78658.1 V-type ATP synthase subunit B [Spirochaetota bacterium]HQH31343.1 V-type ATP synthase subunit B [Spirochaetota bacterium]